MHGEAQLEPARHSVVVVCKLVSLHNTCRSLLYISSRANCSDKPAYTQLRLDKADRAAYYLNTSRYLQPYIGVVQDIYSKYVAGDISSQVVIFAQQHAGA